MKSIQYSIIIPVFKSSDSLRILTQKIYDLFNSSIHIPFEIIFVNDSPFSKVTNDTLREISKTYESVKVIHLTKNFGQHAAIFCGFEHAKGDYIITMDDDLQHDPKDITLFIENQDHDVVIARFKNKKHTLFQKIASEINNFFEYLILKKPLNIKLTGYRLIKRSIVQHMIKRKISNPLMSSLIYAATDDVINIELEHHVRYQGKSNYTLKRMAKMFFNLVIFNSSFLFRLIGFIGAISSVFSVAIMILLISITLLFHVTIDDWIYIVLTISIFGGTILFLLGIIGENLIRTISISENREAFYIRSIQ